VSRGDLHRGAEYRLIMTVVWLVCGLAALASAVPVVEHVTNLVLFAVAGALVLLAALRFAVRFVRERLEDRADERAAAQWRAEHQPASQGVA
jgi:ABC-type transport system involved in cytochrome bd biosynthesis fused ATPase/permease subunit